MSSKRRSIEAEVVRFGMTADVEAVLTLYRVLRGVLEQRGAFDKARATKLPARPRRAAPAAETEPDRMQLT